MQLKLLLFSPNILNLKGLVESLKSLRKEIMMKGSFVYPGFDNENDDNDSNNEFDPRTDFSQFVEEAKRQARQDNENPISQIEQKQVIIDQEMEITKSKKSWKTVLFSFWRSSSSDKKSKKPSKETSSNVHATHTKPQGYVSSPLYNPGHVATTSSGWSRHRLSGSGSLMGLFQPKKREDDEIPYVSLNKPIQDGKVYGPVYLVS